MNQKPMLVEHDLETGAPLVDAAEIVTLTPSIQGKTITFSIPVQATTAPQSGQHIDERFYKVTLPAVDVRLIRTFLGLDQTNYGEYAIDISCSKGRFYSRSLHKEGPRFYYDAWEERQRSNWVVPAGDWWVHTVAHQTAVGSEPHSGNVQFEIVLEVL